MSALDLLGPTLTTSSGTVPTKDALKDKVAVALYFSAHWCGPCRGFTPKLAAAYSDALQAKGLEVIFVSSDRDEAGFADYFKEMPWLALPYADRAAKTKLSKKFKVQGIPTLVILDAKTGETITTDGREAIMEDPTGADFPWRPPTFWDALGTEFLNGEGDTVEVDELKGEGKVIGLYFSAHWCPPCRQFTPMLVSAYSKALKAKNLEIIFVSSDKDQASFQEYFATMPWLAIPPGDKRKGALSKLFGVQGIPTFALVDGATGETISANARGGVQSDPEGESFPWRPKPLVDMVAEGPEGINETPSLCVMLEGCDASLTADLVKELDTLAEASKAAGEDLLWFYAPKTGGPTAQIRALAKLGEPSAAPQLALFDIPDDGGYYVSAATEVTKETVVKFLADYKAGALERKQLG